MNIDKLKAGRELDALVAEKVMEQEPCEQWQLFRAGDLAGPIYTKAGTCRHDNCYPAENVAHYSTNIAAAWTIVKRLASNGYTIYLMDQLGYEVTPDGAMPISGFWRCGFLDEGAHADERPDNEIWFGVEQAETAPLAICHAALRTVKA